MLMCKCDRCGTVYERDYRYLPPYSVEKNMAKLPFPDRVDLCPECNADLEKFMQNIPSRSVIDVTYQDVKPKGFCGFLSRIFGRGREA